MKHQYLIAPLTFLLICSAQAQTSVEASFSGTANAATRFVTKHRHSLDCGLIEKSDDWSVSKTNKVVIEDSKKSQIGSGILSWVTFTTTPFVRLARSINLNTSVTESFEKTEVTLTLNETRGSNRAQFAQGNCWHQDGLMSVNDATVSGSITLRYVVPKNVWALSVSRSQNNGLLQNYSELKNTLNSHYDEGQVDGIVLWVEPGQTIEQVFTIPQSVPGRLDLGSATIVFKPLGSKMDLDSFMTFKNNLLDGKYADIADSKTAARFISETMSVLRMEDDVKAHVKRIAITDLKKMTDELFFIANSVISQSFQKDETLNIKADGLAIKSAAALASYQLAKVLLEDLQPYCKEFEIALPMTGQKQTVIGLRAASFWLSRSMNLVHSYDFTPFETLLKELQSLQMGGKRPTDIVNDKSLAKKLQESYKILVKSDAFEQSPFYVANVDMNRMLSVFNEIGTIDSTQNEIMSKLREGVQLESAFLKQFVRTLMMFKKERTEMIDVQELLQTLSDLKQKQKSIETAMAKSIRLLNMDKAQDQNQIISQIADLLNHQINIFSKPLEIPYFDKIRDAYMNKQVKNLEESVQGCFAAGGY